MIEYEWDVEELDECGEILDHVFCRSYRAAMAHAATVPRCAVALVRTEWGPHGVEDREWAYFKDGRTHGFGDSMGTIVRQVPQRFLKEAKA